MWARFVTARLWFCHSLPFRDPSSNYEPFDPKASAVRALGVSIFSPWGTLSRSNLTCASKAINVMVIRNASVEAALPGGQKWFAHLNGSGHGCSSVMLPFGGWPLSTGPHGGLGTSSHHGSLGFWSKGWFSFGFFIVATVELQWSSLYLVVSDSLRPHGLQLSLPGLSVPHHLPKFAQVHVRCISDAIQPFHPLSPSSPPAFNISQHQGLLQWVSSSHQVAKVLELQHQSFQWVFRLDFP